MARVTSLAALALLTFIATRAAAMTVLPLDLGALTGGADRIFVGRVERVDTGRDGNGLPATWTTFTVIETMKGASGGHVVLKQLGATLGGSDAPVLPHPGLPRYRPGESVVLFMQPDSTLGFTSPVGLGQGCFRVRDGDGVAVVENDVGNRNLAPAANGARTRAAAAAPVAPAPLPLDELRARVRALVDATP